MTDEELRDELDRLLATDPRDRREGDVLVLHHWDGQEQDPPLRLHATAAEVGERCRVDAETRDALWPSATAERAGLNLLLAHLDETLTVGLDVAPERRHVVLSPHLALLTDPAVRDEPPPRVPLPDPPPRGHVWSAHFPLSGATYPGTGVVSGDGAALDLLRAFLLCETVVGDGLPPEVHQYLSDEVSREFGGDGARHLHEVVRSRFDGGADLAALARDRAFLDELLAVLRG